MTPNVASQHVTPTTTSPVWPDQPIVTGNSYPVELAAGGEGDGRRALARLLERVETHQRINSSLREYEWRVANNVPYEDVVDAEEFRRRYGV